ncbi:MAG: hypothetical protein KIT02_05740 [Devosia sp.]|uniref:hypothetical protein n=1 Tax=Devosia sp. TaxID=1871048 RepID=UPI0024C56C8D|nr:hypothetical protein [Devosia sp.]UYO00715.1 MAG: hypothetical protein KIT02_05740 [Devosia sp.]
MPEMTVRPAARSELALVHRELIAVINSSAHYNDLFKAHETARLNRTFLDNLHAIDPWHIMLVCLDGDVGGVIVSGPDCGTLFRYWSWVFPAYRQSRLSLFAMRVFDEHWDNGRFHKVSTYVRPENDVACTMLKRYGYEQTCLLRQHIFGQDYLVYEKFFTRQDLPYDHGVNIGRLGRLRKRLAGLFGA